MTDQLLAARVAVAARVPILNRDGIFELEVGAAPAARHQWGGGAGPGPDSRSLQQSVTRKPGKLPVPGRGRQPGGVD